MEDIPGNANILQFISSNHINNNNNSTNPITPPWESPEKRKGSNIWMKFRMQLIFHEDSEMVFFDYFRRRNNMITRVSTKLFPAALQNRKDRIQHNIIPHNITRHQYAPFRCSRRSSRGSHPGSERTPLPGSRCHSPAGSWPDPSLPHRSCRWRRASRMCSRPSCSEQSCGSG